MRGAESAAAVRRNACASLAVITRPPSPRPPDRPIIQLRVDARGCGGGGQAQCGDNSKKCTHQRARTRGLTLRAPSERVVPHGSRAPAPAQKKRGGPGSVGDSRYTCSFRAWAVTLPRLVPPSSVAPRALGLQAATRGFGAGRVLVGQSGRTDIVPTAEAPLGLSLTRTPRLNTLSRLWRVYASSRQRKTTDTRRPFAQLKQGVHVQTWHVSTGAPARKSNSYAFVRRSSSSSYKRRGGEPLCACTSAPARLGEVEHVVCRRSRQRLRSCRHGDKDKIGGKSWARVALHVHIMRVAIEDDITA